MFEFLVINIVLESCQNHVKDKKMSFKLDTLLSVVRVCICVGVRFMLDTGHTIDMAGSGFIAHKFIKIVLN